MAARKTKAQLELEKYVRDNLAKDKPYSLGFRNSTLSAIRPELLPREDRWSIPVTRALEAVGQDPRGASRLGRTIVRPFATTADFVGSFPDAVNSLLDTGARAERTGRPATGEDYAAGVANVGLNALDMLAPALKVPASGRRVMNKAVPYYFREAPMVVPRAAAEEAAPTARNFAVATMGGNRAKRAAEKRAALQVKGPPARPELPAPDPADALPPYAVKPRGGNWLVTDNTRSPEMRVADFVNEYGFDEALDAWLQKTLPRYLRRDFGAPNDPLRDLAARGQLQGVESPEVWDTLARNAIGANQTAGDLLRLKDFYGKDPEWVRFMQEEYAKGPYKEMPWLQKLPSTERVYSLYDVPRPVRHIADEMANALNPESGLPADLLIDPKSLERMSFPQAAERVARINAFRAKQMEEASQAAMDNPAIHTFKEYPEAGMRWVELKPPEGTVKPTREALAENSDDWLDPNYVALREALRHEGDTMGHCVGGYCPDVMEGRSRIFSLRDAKGQPHVTIETAPGGKPAFADIPKDALEAITAAAKADTDDVAARAGVEIGSPKWNRTYQINLDLKRNEWLRNNPLPESIVQIKGKQNAAPHEKYLPFVQDFVKSSKWGDIGDFENTGLVRFRGDLMDRAQYNDLVKSAHDFFKQTPAGQAVRNFYKGRFGDYGTEPYKAAEKFIERTIVPVGNVKYSLKDIYSVLDDPEAWDEGVMDLTFKGVDWLRENPLDLPPELINGFAKGGKVKRFASRKHNFKAKGK